MNELNELKDKIFTVMNSAVKLSMNFQGKGTILENKKQDYLMRLMTNLETKGIHYKKLDVKSPDFNLLLSKSRKVLDHLKKSDYNNEVKRYVNDVAYMFEGEFKSIAQIKKPESIKVKSIEIEKEFKSKEVECKCGSKKSFTTDDLLNLGRIKESRIVKCENCGEILMTVLAPTDKRNKIMKQHLKEEEELDMELLDELDESLE